MNRIDLIKLLWLVLLLFPGGLFAQVLPQDKTTGKFYYSEEVLVKDGPQMDLYHRAKTWFNLAGQNKKTINLDDSKNGMLAGDILTELAVVADNQKQKFKLKYTVNLQLSDDRYWLSLNNFQLQKIVSLNQNRSTKELIVNSQPLEVWLNGKEKVNSKVQIPAIKQKLEKAVYKSIFTQMEDLNAHML
ncbi:DUF4468 domain-containing protein [Adhaeribacter radiodurans]|uniref:DUF4468 domain-containing protein n=1 Tax=Adhaeribacter radiodurans TaxID=2745197 RepID=A0A7L7L4U9_9BACT|nr:DUF4468 domain-containing protein [Adhaeribacter radiodurans]QMU27841.1 DUF4468 domain-containing protein [Adhaeribacter radiodurans]